MNFKRKVFILISIIFIFFISIILINKNIIEEKYSLKLIEIIEKDEESKLSKDQLILYEDEIKKELDEALQSNDNNIKELYYCLGAIKYLEKENYESNKYLREALKYKAKNEVDIDIKIYSALSSNYIMQNKSKESDMCFEQAKSIALKNNKKHLLCELYYGRAKSKLQAGNNINESIDLMIKSLEYTDRDLHKIRNYLYLSKLYKLTSKFDLSMEYILNALEIANDINDKVLINKCIIDIGENYYIQKNYTKTIEIYEGFIKTNEFQDYNNELVVYSYLLECYARKGDYINYQVYKDKYIEIAEKNNAVDRLAWIYAIVAELEVEFFNQDLAKEYILKSEELYEKNKNEMYLYLDIILDFVKNKIDYFENKDYEKTLQSYTNSMKRIDEIGMKSDVRDHIVNEILKTSFEEQDYDTFIQYIKLKDDKNTIESSQTYTDSVFKGIDKAKNEREIMKSNLRFVILLICTIITIYALVDSRIKNIKIKQLNSKLKKINILDPLTNIYNRGYLNKKLKESCENKEQISFIMMDIDCFKLYNDNYGHVKGDQVLVEVAKIINDVFKNDTVFRYGGEEFSVISYKTIDELIVDLDRLKSEIYNKNIVHEYSIVSDRVTLSIGLSNEKLDNESDLSKLIERADENLYKSKQNGRNKYTY